MENYFDQDKAIAIVYLLSEGDNDNKAAISEDQLLVIRNSRRKVFLIKHISILKPENIKLLFPLILGGIITPFAFLSYFANLFLPWIHLVSILGGMFLFYIGWLGKSSFTIVLKNGEELNFFLPSISKNLQAFIDFVNTLQTKHTDDLSVRNLLFFEIDKKNENILFGKDSKINSHHLFPLFGMSYSQMNNLGKSIYGSNLLTINPRKAGREIKFEFDIKSNQMRPKLDGPILEESKVNLSDFR